MDLTAPVRRRADDPDLASILDLLRAGFAYMDGRIDPPSSLHRMDVDDIRDHCQTGEVWTIGAPPVACMFLTYKPGALYVGKLCVAETARSRGLARALIDMAQDRARTLDLPVVELQTRVELTENHATFARLGFVEVGRTAHAGYDRPTSVTMQLRV